LSHMNPIRIIIPYFFKIHFNVFLPSMTMSLTLSLPLRFSDENFVHVNHLSDVCYMHRPSHCP
jgi:hypothetical protein